MKNYIFCFLSALILAAPQVVSAQEQYSPQNGPESFEQFIHLIPRFAEIITTKAVEYFSSKNEICSEQKTKKVSGTLVRLIEVHDVFSPDSTEVYCTVVLKGKDQKLSYYSAASSICKLVRTLGGAQEFSWTVAGDHICPR